MKKVILTIMMLLLSLLFAVNTFAAQAVEGGEVPEDGINTNVATIWIICVSAVVASVIIGITIFLAKKNKNN